MAFKCLILGGIFLAGCLDEFPAPPNTAVVFDDPRDRGQTATLDAEVPAPDGRAQDRGVVPPPPRGDGAPPPPGDRGAPPPPPDDRGAPPPPPRDAEPPPTPPDAEPPLPELAGPGDVVINEVDYNQPGDDDREFIELLVTSDHPVVVSGVRVELYSEGNGESVPCGDEDPPEVGPTRYRCAVLEGVFNPGERLVLTTDGTALEVRGDAVELPLLGEQNRHGNIQNGEADGILLVARDNTVLDGLAYDGFLEGVGEREAAIVDDVGGQPAEDGGDEGNNDPPLERSLSRCTQRGDEGVDTNNNKADFLLKRPTPGAPNQCGE